MAHHVEYGGNYPAMHRSWLRLKAMGLSPREDRRSASSSETKVQKQMCISQREQERDEASCPGHVLSEAGHSGWKHCVLCFKQVPPDNPGGPVVG